MAIIRLPASTGPELTDSLGDVVVFDVMTSQATTLTVSLSQHNLESGAKTTDHARVEPRTMELSVSFTNTPNLEADDRANRDVHLKDQLEAIAARREPITVATTWGVYRDWMILTVNPSRSSSTGQHVPISMSLQEVTFSQSEIEDVPPAILKAKAKRSGSSKKNGGRQTGDDLGTSTTGGGFIDDIIGGFQAQADAAGVPRTPATSEKDPAAPEKEKAAEKKTSKLKNLLG